MPFIKVTTIAKDNRINLTLAKGVSAPAILTNPTVMGIA